MIALGSNLGDRRAWLSAARSALAMLPDSRILAASDVEETPPFGPVAQGPYLNQILAVETSLTPGLLLAALHAIERSLGRVRGVRWGPRTIDLDIVQLGDTVLRAADLTLPHPGLADRPFWQRELAQLEGLLAIPAAIAT